MIVIDKFNPYINYPAILEIDQNGDLIKYHFPTDTVDFHYYEAWVKKSDKEFKVVGSAYDSANVGSFFLLTLNENLDLISKVIYKMPRKVSAISKFKQLPNGDLAFCGLTQNYDEINKKIEEQQAVFYLLDSLGNELWHVEYGDPINNEKFFDFTWDKDYNFYLVGQWVEPYIDADFQSLLVKVNKDGKVLWGKLYGIKDNLDYFGSIKFRVDSNLVCVGGYGPGGFINTKGALQISIIDTLGSEIFYSLLITMFEFKIS